MHNLDAIVLAGGMGTRLRGVIADRPKVLAAVGGRPFITHLLDQLVLAGVKSITLATGYMASKVEDEIGSSYRGLPVRYSPEPEPLGTGGGLRLALGKTSSDPLLVLNGDSFCAVNLKQFYNEHVEKGSRATMLLTEVSDTSRYGRVEMAANDVVLRFDEKGASRSAGWINAGVYLLAREIISSIAADRAVSLESQIFPGLLNGTLSASQTGGDFLDIGTPESYAKAERFFAPAQEIYRVS